MILLKMRNFSSLAFAQFKSLSHIMEKLFGEVLPKREPTKEKFDSKFVTLLL